jgi:hypothetical protein
LAALALLQSRKDLYGRHSVAAPFLVAQRRFLQEENAANGILKP